MSLEAFSAFYAEMSRKQLFREITQEEWDSVSAEKARRSREAIRH
jgi:hypothetical protein